MDCLLTAFSVNVKEQIFYELFRGRTNAMRIRKNEESATSGTRDINQQSADKFVTFSMMRINLPLPDARLPASLFSLWYFFSSPPPVPVYRARRTARDEIDRDRAMQLIAETTAAAAESGCNRNSREFGALLSESRRFNQRPTENR